MTSNIRKAINESSCIKLVRALVKEVLLSEDEKPGGGLTDVGAEMKIDPQNAIIHLKGALAGAPRKGRVKAAAKELGVSPSLIYHYTSEDPKAHAPPALKGYLDVLDGQEQGKEKKSKSSQKKNVK
jgi:hypothetical protein